mgnify:CR=1 FL=1
MDSSHCHEVHFSCWMLRRVGGFALARHSGFIRSVPRFQARNYCLLEEAPLDQEKELTEIPRNFYDLRYNPGPGQLLWEEMNEPGVTTDQLYE